MYIARQCFDIVDLIGRALKTCASYPESFFSIMDLGRKPRMNQLNPYSIFTWKKVIQMEIVVVPLLAFIFVIGI